MEESLSRMEEICVERRISEWNGGDVSGMEEI